MRPGTPPRDDGARPWNRPDAPGGLAPRVAPAPSSSLPGAFGGCSGRIPSGAPRSRMYARCKWASFRSGTAIPIPAITAGPSLFARSSARWHLGPVARTLALAPRARQDPWVGGSRRVYPVQDATRGAMKPPVPLGPYSTPGEMRPNGTATRRNRAPHRPWVIDRVPMGSFHEA